MNENMPLKDAELTAQPGPSRTWGPLQWVLMVLVVAILILAAVMVLRPRQEDAVATGDANVLKVRTLAVAVQDMPDVAQYAARFEAGRNVVVSVEQAGRVDRLGADKGQVVTNGQMLLQVDSRSQAATVLRAEASFRQVAEDVRRLEDLKKTGAVSATDLENLKTQKTLAESGLLQAKLDLERCTVTSPLNGMVDDRRVEAGEYLNLGNPVFVVVSQDPLKVTTDLPERDVFAVKAGQEIPVTVDALPDQVFTGRITFVSATADLRSNTFRLEVEVANKSGVLRPGVIGRVQIIRRTIPAAVTVPLLALIPEKGQHVAFVVENGHAVRRQVRLAAMVNNLAVIGEGLKPGERIIVEGHRLVTDGSPVSEEGAVAVKTAENPGK